MKIQFISSINFILLFIQNLSEILVGDSNNISIDLLGSNTLYEYTIYNETKNETMVCLIKSKTKNIDIIQSHNYLIVNSTRRAVNYENIDSFYLNKLIIIFPRGKSHPNDWTNDAEIIPDDGFQENSNWDLKCYGHDTGFFLFFYLGNNIYNFYFSLDNRNDIDKCVYCIKTNLYDVAVENGLYGTSYSYKFPILKKDDNNLILERDKLNFDSVDFRLSFGGMTNIMQIIQI